MANNSLTTNFNTSPYYDDYDETRGYYRILFKPSQAVQTRELTQLQTMLQKQIDRFGEHIFKEGSLVSGGKSNIDFKYQFVKIADTDNFAFEVSVSDWLGKTIEGQTNGVTAIVVNAIDGEEINDPDTKTLYVKYLSSGNDNTTKLFVAPENLISNTGLSVNILSANTSLGTGTAFTIDEGVLFAKDHFIRFDAQTIILDKYTTTPSCVVGFVVEESIVTHQEDTTLLDNAQGTRNYTAPGADRLKLTPVLVKYNLDEIPSDDFIELLAIEDGVILRRVDKPEYSIIKEELARRTYDESGNYIRNGLNVRIREHLNDTQNNGYKLIADGGDSTKLAIGIEPGKAYVFGFDVETIGTIYQTIDKGIDYNIAEQQIISTNYGAYLRVNEAIGHWPVNDGVTVDLYNAAEARVSSLKYSGPVMTGTKIGTAKLRVMKYESGVGGTASAVYRAYITNIKMTSSSFEAVRSIYFDGVNADACADVILEGGIAVLKETAFNIAVYPIAVSSVRSLRDENNAIDTTYSFLKSFDVSVATPGTFTVTTGSADEIFPFSAGALNNDQKYSKFVVNLNGPATVSLTGTANTTASSNTLSGVGTAFTTQLRVGDKVKVVDTGNVATVVAIANNTSLTVTPAFAASDASSAIKKQYYAGDLLNYTVNGTSNVARSITVNSSTSTTFDLKETLDGVVSATVTLELNKVDAPEKKKVLRKSRYVLVDCATNVANTVGPWDLGFSDIIGITSVRKGTSIVAVSSGTDVTNYFNLDNGQRDASYEHGRLALKSNSGLSVTGADKLLVQFDYFEHDLSIGKGYFSVDSYPIDDVNGAANTNAITTAQIPFFKSPTSGALYDLRNCVDIRPTKQATANSTVSLVSITTNPAITESYQVSVSGLQYPAPNEEFVTDLSYYLPRKDLIIARSGGAFESVRGKPALVPITPDAPADAMPLAVILVAPYPSLPAVIAQKYGRTDYAVNSTFIGNRRYTMRDIGVLEQRIESLEYYVSLSLLEKNTMDMKILDGDGLDRFKNGIIVDPFTSHKVGDINNPDYSIAIDRKANELRPKFEMFDIPLKVMSSTAIQTTGNLITLPYTLKSHVSQMAASSTRNAAGLFYNFLGEIALNPETDFWTDTKTAPDLVINDNGDLTAWQTLANAWGTQWNSWATTWTGTTTASRTTATAATVGRTAGSTTTTTTTNTTNQSRVGQTLVVSSTIHEQDYGTRVIDTSLAPYMRARKVQVQGFGLKANTKLYAFFDGEDVNAFVTQTNASYVATKARGQNVVTDASGVFYAIFDLPNTTAKRFTVGTKTLRFTDSITNSSTAGAVTTAGEASYSAFGNNQTKQDTIVATSVPQVAMRSVTQTRTFATTSTSTSTTPGTPIINPTWTNSGSSHEEHDSFDPVAETFTVDTAGQAPGIFFAKLDIYLATKDPKYGVTVELREVDASGVVTNKIVPGSQVSLPSASLSVSADGSVATSFTFKNLVYLLDKTDYAIVVKPEATNPNTVLWVAKLGEKDIMTGIKISKQPFAGVLLASSNDKTWTPYQDEDLKFNLHRAVFDGSVNGQVTFSNDDLEFINANTVTGIFENNEIVNGETRFTLNTVSAGGVAAAPGQTVLGLTSGATGTLTTVSNTTFQYAKDIWANTLFQANETIQYRYANNTPTGKTAKITSFVTPTGTLADFTLGTATGTADVQIKNTFGAAFRVGEQFIGQNSNASLIIDSFHTIPANLFSHNASFITMAGTDILWTARNTDQAGNLLPSNDILINGNNEEVAERLVKSYTSELGSKTLRVQAVLYTGSNFVSPVIDKSRTHSILVHNLINNDSTGENAKNGGNAVNRYITGKVTLAEGQDAEDLQVTIAAYKPPASDVKVYFKAIHAEDADLFEDRSWIEMNLSSKDIYSDIENKDDFKEFTYGIPVSLLTGSNAEFQYVNSANVTFTGFKYFAFKIILLSDNSSEFPRLNEFRGIALQK